MSKSTNAGLVTKAATARAMKISRSMVAKYVLAGMPVDECTGLIPIKAALAWRKKYICSPLSGSYFHRQRMKAEKAAPELSSFQAGGMHVANSLRHEAVVLNVAEIAFEVCGDVRAAFCIARNFEMYVALIAPFFLKIPEEASVIEFTAEPDWKAFAAARGAVFNSLEWEAAANKAATNTWSKADEETEPAAKEH